MRTHVIAGLGLAMLLGVSGHAFGMAAGPVSGSGTASPGGGFSGSLSDGSKVTGTCSGGQCTAAVVSATEPLTALLVGAGLVGARLLRRR